MLPRYVFRGTGEGCGQAGHAPSCLCDVDVTTPAPIYRGDLMFGALALREIDADVVSPRNLLEFASVLLGCYEEHLRLPPVALVPYEGHDMPQAVTFDRERKRWAELGMPMPTAHQAFKTHRLNRSDSPVKLGGYRNFQPLRNPPACWYVLHPDVQDHIQFHWTVDTPWSRIQHLVASGAHSELRCFYMKRAREFRGGTPQARARAKARKVSA